mgnify:CR=1 FL=1
MYKYAAMAEQLLTVACQRCHSPPLTGAVVGACCVGPSLGCETGRRAWWSSFTVFAWCS